MHVALIGTRGVPARYGGFETAAEEIGQRLAAKGHRVTVFCRPVPGEPRPERYLGMELVHLPSVKVRQLETLSHTALSVLSPRLRGVEAAVVFNAANAPLLPVLRVRGIPMATHVDGLEWQRAKWGPRGRAYYRAAEAACVRLSDALIADAQGIADYYRDEFNAPTRLIAYGATIRDRKVSDRIAELGLQPGAYHLVVARLEPENHVLEIVRGYVASASELPLVVVGTAPYADAYIEQVHRAADERVKFTGGVWDNELLDQLYENARTYLHGHSVGGTNPSLLRAAGAGAFVGAWDVSFNREVVGEFGEYFDDTPGLVDLLARAEAHPASCRERGGRLREAIVRYNWDDVAHAYERLLLDLKLRNFPRRRPSGRRNPPRRTTSDVAQRGLLAGVGRTNG